MPTKTPEDEKYNPSAKHADDLFERHGVLNEGIASKEGAIDQARSRLRGAEESGSTTSLRRKDQDLSAAENNGLYKPSPAGAAASLTGFGGIKAFLSTKKGKASAGGGVVGLVAAIMFFFSLFGSLNVALINFKENIAKRINTQAAVIEQRAEQATERKLFRSFRGTKGHPERTMSCKVRVQCRYKGISEKQRVKLEKAGIKLVDAKPTKLSKFGVTRYTASALEYDNGSGKRISIDAQHFKHAYMNLPKFRKDMQRAYKGRFASFADRVAVRVAHKFKISRNIKWDGSTEKESRKQLRRVVSGDEYNKQINEVRSGDTVDERTKEERQKDKKNGDKPAKIDLGEYASDVNNEAKKIDAKFKAGEHVNPLPGVAEVATAEPYQGSTHLGSKIANFLNPLGFATAFCTGYKLSQAVVFGAKIYGQRDAMRYAYQFAGVADKMKAGNASPQEVSNAMNILYRKSKSGTTMSDSFGFKYATTGKVSDAPLSRSASGGGVVRLISNAISTTESMFPVNSTCNVLLNPWAQGALILVSFIPGGGQLAKMGAKIAGKAITGAAKKIVRDEIKKIIKDTAEKTFTRQAAKDMGRKLLQLGNKRALAGFLALYLTARYGVPALAHYLTHSDYTGDENGEDAANGIYLGMDLVNQKTAQARGLKPLTNKEYAAFTGLKQQSLLADLSAKNSDNSFLDNTKNLASALMMKLSTLPGLSFSSLFNLPSFAFGQAMSTISPVYAATSASDYCQDPAIKKTGLATDPFCVVQLGFANQAALKNENGNTGPEDVVNYMLKPSDIKDDDGKPIPQINGDGSPVPGSEYEEFVNDCFDPTAHSLYGTATENDQTVPEKCYKKTDKKYVMFRLYTIDTSVYTGMLDQWGDDGIGHTPSKHSDGPNTSVNLIWPIHKSDWPKTSQPIAECGLKYSDGTVHTGIDISVPYGTPVYAAADGVVTMDNSSYGALNIKTTYQDDDGSPLYLNYQHLSKKFVHFGDNVHQGQKIGLSGHTGTSANHLHFGVWTTNRFIGGHPPADSAKGKELYSLMKHPMNYLPHDGRNVNECQDQGPYGVPND